MTGRDGEAGQEEVDRSDPQLRPSAAGAAEACVDGDARLRPDWFEGARSCLRDSWAALVTGPVLPRLEAKSPSRLEHFWQTDRHGGRHAGALTLFGCVALDGDMEPTVVSDANLTGRRTVFDEVPGSYPDNIPSPGETFEGDGKVGQAYA